MSDAKMLVVDDNDMVRSVAQQMLVALGYEASVVDSLVLLYLFKMGAPCELINAR